MRICSPIFYCTNENKNMKAVILFAVLFSFGVESGRGIMIASQRQFTFQVSVRILRKHHCSGSIIADKTVLTAAQCIKTVVDTSMISILAGTKNLKVGGKVFGVRKTIFPPGFTKNFSGNDIALIKTSSSFFQHNGLSKAVLGFDRIPSYNMVTVSGWGQTQLMKPLTLRLKYLRVKALDVSECSYKLLNMYALSKANICTLSGDYSGVCFYDAGSPVVYNGKLVGLVTWALFCGRGFPDVHTRIASHRDWILKNIN